MNDVMPSWKSAVARTASLIAGIAAMAAGSSTSSARRALAIVWVRASGAHVADLGGDRQRPFDLLARLDDLLHEPDAVGLGGRELVGGQQVVHRVAPAGALDVADRRPAERRQSPLRLELAEAGVGGGDDDVAGQRDLDADGERDALHGGDQRLGEAAPQAERVDRLGTVGRAAVGVGTEEQRHVEPRRRVVAGEREHADPQIGVLVEPGHRRAELARDLRGEGVLLLDAIDGHVQHVVVDDVRVHLAVRVASSSAGVGSVMERTLPVGCTKERTTVADVTRTDTSAWPCTIARSADVLGDGWNLLIIRQACLGIRRFDDFQRALGIGRNILTTRLNRLVDEGLLTRVEYQQRPSATSTASPTRVATSTRSSPRWRRGATAG